MPFTEVLRDYLWPSGLTPRGLVFSAVTLILPIHTLSDHGQIFTALNLSKLIQRVTALLSHLFLTTDQWLPFRWHMNYCLITNRCPREYQHTWCFLLAPTLTPPTPQPLLPLPPPPQPPTTATTNKKNSQKAKPFIKSYQLLKQVKQYPTFVMWRYLTKFTAATTSLYLEPQKLVLWQ